MNAEEVFGSWRGGAKQFQEIDAALAKIAFEESSSEELEDEDDDFEDGDARCSGLRQCNPDLYEWLMERIGAPADLFIVLVFLVVDAWSFVMDEAMWDSKVNLSSMMVMANLASLSVSLTATFSLEGTWAVKKLLNCAVFWRFLIAALLFQTAWRVDADAYIAGTKPIVVKTLGYLYMPLSALASWVIFRRGYGRLEWLSLLMMTLAMTAFCLLRERCREGSCEGNAYSHDWPNALGICLVLSGVLFSCTASLLCERIYKDRSFGLLAGPYTGHNKYSLHKVHLDFSGLLISLAIWCCPIQIKKSMWGVPYSTSWFGEWTWRNYLYIPVQVLHWWMAGLVAKRYSTVTKALIQTVAVGLVVILEDPMIASEKFSQVMVPSLCMLVIIVLSALIFQTGRINLTIASASFASEKVMQISVGVRSALTDAMTLRSASVDKDKTEFSLKDLATKYMVIILYTLADATRTLLYTVSLGKSMITPQSFSVAMNGAMLVLSNVLLYFEPPVGTSGAKAVREAWTPRKLLKFLPCGFLFALTSALMSMAMGLGISGSLSVVIGKIYLPICAISSRCLLGKYYMWLEWFAIIILTLDSAAFGFLKDMGAGGRPTNKLAIVACMFSAASSAMSAMVMEKLMKSEPGKPFMMQKLRTDVACCFWSIVFLPVMGWLADPQHFPKGAYWLYRPATYTCNRNGVCGTWTGNEAFAPWDGGGTFAYYGANDTFVSSVSLASEHGAPAGCTCAKGVWACWGDVMIYLMLIVAVFYGFITGLVVTKFGGVLRAIADNFSLLLVYAIGDPLVNGTNLRDNSLNLTAVILPLSSQTFSQAAEELRSIQRIKAESEGREEVDETESFIGSDSKSDSDE